MCKFKYRIKANGFILQQHAEWPDRRKDFPAWKVVGHEGYTFFLGVERSFYLGWLDLHP